MGSEVELHHGDAIVEMDKIEANSIPTIITDPPYGLQFMGKDWDHGVPGVPYWKAALRVAKPGAMLLAFGGTRTHHRLMCAIEDAGWEIRDCLMWLYGSGFPKSHDISKAIDKAATVACPSCGGDGVYRFETSFDEWITKTADYGGTSEEWARLMAGNGGPCDRCGGTGKVVGATREVVGRSIRPDGSQRTNTEKHGGTSFDCGSNDKYITAPSTPAAQLWDGWGTALKPAWEPIILAMKPRDGTFAHNALEHGVAGLWIDGGRVPGKKEGDPARFLSTNGMASENVYAQDKWTQEQCHGVMVDVTKGRWPANLILSHNPDCRRVGVRRVKNNSGSVSGKEPSHPGDENSSCYGEYQRIPFDRHADPDGTEQVESWECSEGCAVALLDAQSGERPSAGHYRFPEGDCIPRANSQSLVYGKYNNHLGARRGTAPYSGESGGASRFFQHCDWSEDDVRFWYCGKASKRERNAGCDDLYWRKDKGVPFGFVQVTEDEWDHLPEKQRAQGNVHSTVKPLSLMRYLVRLTRTPIGGVVLDPFCGSGSTGGATILEGRDFIGIDSDIEAIEISTGRTDYAQNEMAQLEKETSCQQ